MISLIIPPRDQISRVNKMLADEVRVCLFLGQAVHHAYLAYQDNRPIVPTEIATATTITNQYGTATNIKSRTNRLSVLDAITSTQQRLKLYSKVPPNGLVSAC